MRSIQTLTATLITFLTISALGHGEDKLGPHFGFIRMPGAYHTELYPESEKEAKVWLLDINWKNPTVKSSTVKIVIPGNGPSEIECKAKESTYFSCPLPKGFNFKSPGQLIVRSTREGQKGVDAVYDLPLKLLTNNNSHSGHH